MPEKERKGKGGDSIIFGAFYIFIKELSLNYVSKMLKQMIFQCSIYIITLCCGYEQSKQ